MTRSAHGQGTESHNIFAALDRTRALRALVNSQAIENAQTLGEVNFHLGCAEVALLRLLLEEEHRINSSLLQDSEQRPGGFADDQNTSRVGDS